MAIELVLTLRLVFHMGLRQAEGVARSVLALLGRDLAVPDHTTLSRRSRAFAGRQPRVRAGTGPVHLVLGSTGLGLFGQGEWCAAKHGWLRRRWLKLRIGVDAATGEVAAHVLTDGDEDDTADPDQQSPRDRHVLLLAERGRIGSQRATEYGRRSQAETAVSRCKHLIGPKLRARSRPAQHGEVVLAVAVLNRMICTAKPVSVRR